MIAIIADDFSGAAELAGIAAARGFKAEVQTVFDPATDAEVIAIDTDTRLKSGTEASRIVSSVGRQVAAAQPDWIFKKTDSVLRGHPREEIEALLEVTGLTSCILIPANPSKGRVVRDGLYFIDNVPLHETVFARDPDHPRNSSRIRELVGATPRLLIPDIRTIDDIPPQVAEDILPAGAADFFSSLLPAGEPVLQPAGTSRTLFLCGSLAAWESGRSEQMRNEGVTVKTLDDIVSPSIWQSTSRLMLAIGKPENGPETEWLSRLTAVALPLIADRSDLRIALEGGATAAALIRCMGWTTFEVIPEGHTGAGTLRPLGGPILNVKPGSYPWPLSLIRHRPDA